MQVFLTLSAMMMAMPLFISASPIAPELVKRAPTVCKETWQGELIMTHLISPLGAPNQIPAYIAPNGLLQASVGKSQAPIKVHFDTCTAPGWSVGGREFGQIRLIANHDTCLTIGQPGSPSSTLSFVSCRSDTLDPVLASQWVEGFTGPSGAYNLVFKGNPNDANAKDRSQVMFNYFDTSSALNPVTIGSPGNTAFPTRFQLQNKAPVQE